MSTTQSGDGGELIVIKVWMEGVCNHRVLDTRDGSTAAVGRGPTEKKSWMRTAAVSASRF
jgi:hypothetical protein